MQTLPKEFDYRSYDREETAEKYGDGRLILAEQTYMGISDYLREESIFRTPEYIRIGYPSGGSFSGGSYIMGHGGGVATQHVYCQDISWDQAQPGDLIFYPDDSHAGIVGGWDDAGNMLVIHCASGRDNVVVTGSSGFNTIGRPYFYGE